MTRQPPPTSWAQQWSQATDGIESDPENFEDFGSALGAGDFNGDSSDDLAIGTGAGAVCSGAGSGAGLRRRLVRRPRGERDR